MISAGHFSKIVAGMVMASWDSSGSRNQEPGDWKQNPKPLQCLIIFGWWSVADQVDFSALWVDHDPKWSFLSAAQEPDEDMKIMMICNTRSFRFGRDLLTCHIMYDTSSDSTH